MNNIEKRKLRQKIQTGITRFICDNVKGDEEFFLALLYASQEINNCLARFDDIFDERENEKEE